MSEYRVPRRDQKFQIRSSSAAGFFSEATQSCMSLEQRIDQLEDKVLDSNPVTKKIHEKVKMIDEKLSATKYGNVYSKFKKMAQGMGRLLIAKEIGVAAVAGLCVYNFARNMKPMFYDAEKARQNCECEDLGDYMARNKGKSARTIAKATLGAVAASCGLGEAYTVREVARTGVASIVAWPELKNVWKNAKDFVCRKASWNDFAASCALFGTTVAAYAYGSGVWNSADANVDAPTSSVEGHTEGISDSQPTTSASDEIGKADGSASLSDAKKKEKKPEDIVKPGITADFSPSEKTIVLPLQKAIRKFDDYVPNDGPSVPFEKYVSLQQNIAQKSTTPVDKKNFVVQRKINDAMMKKSR